MKTRACAAGDARKRLAAARKFLDVAEIYCDEDDPEGLRVAVANAVHAGIAAAGAMCCARLAEHVVGDDHRAAADLVKGIGREGNEAAKALAALLGVKNKAQYQTAGVGKRETTGAVRRARTLVELAERLVFAST